MEVEGKSVQLLSEITVQNAGSAPKIKERLMKGGWAGTFLVKLDGCIQASSMYMLWLRVDDANDLVYRACKCFRKGLLMLLVFSWVQHRLHQLFGFITLVGPYRLAVSHLSKSFQTFEVRSSMTCIMTDLSKFVLSVARHSSLAPISLRLLQDKVVTSQRRRHLDLLISQATMLLQVPEFHT
eukprot:76382-Amphidinium_carterae.1